MKRWAWMLGVVVIVGAGVGAWWVMRTGPLARVRGGMTREVYVWQRSWGEEVRGAVREHGRDFGRVVVLGAQISWEKGTEGKVMGKVFKVPVAWGEVKGAAKSVGVAVRIGGFIKGEAYEGEAAQVVEETVRGVVKAGRAAGVDASEVQIDFDAAESKLGGYLEWVKAAKRGSGGVAVRVTALPSWLKRREFAELARECGGYVLQVHSLERPKRLEEAAVLCDVGAARTAVEKAGKLGVPFRVALPTYGYLLVFDGEGKFAGMEAEGAAAAWPEGHKKRWLGAEARELSALVAGWEAERPAAMEGVIWYRLPVATDRRNWKWATLAAVMAGRRPTEKWAVECVRAEEAGVREVVVRNIGEEDGRGTMVVEVSWAEGILEASDVIGGFERVGGGEGTMVMRGLMGADERIGPGEVRKVGWMRFAGGKEPQMNTNAHR